MKRFACMGLVTAAILLPAGATAWRTGGVALVEPPSRPANSQQIVLAPDHDGGVVAHWIDTRPVGGDAWSWQLYSQHVGDDGFREWPPGGRALAVLSADAWHALIGGVEDGRCAMSVAGEAGGTARLSLRPLRADGAPTTTWQGTEGWSGLAGSVFAAATHVDPFPRIPEAPASAEPAALLVATITDPAGLAPGEVRARLLTPDGQSTRLPAEGVRLADIPGEYDGILARNDAQGHVYVVWSTKPANSQPPGLFITRVDPNSGLDPGWSVGGLALAPDFSYGPITMVPDGQDGMYVVWAVVEAAAPGVRTFIAQHVTGAGGIAPGWPAAGIAFGLTTASGSCRAAGDGQGGLFVGWPTGPDALSGVRTAIVRRFGPDGTPPAGWPLGNVVLGGGHRELELDLVADGAGGLYATVWTFDDVLAYEPALRLQHRTATAAVSPGWPAAGVLVANAQPNFAGTLVTDGVPATGGVTGAIVAWSAWTQTAEGPQPVVHAQRFAHDSQPTVESPRSPITLAAVTPQPTAQSAWVRFGLGEPGATRISVVDVRGRRVRTLLAATPLDRGMHAYLWDGRDDGGLDAGSGVFFVRVESAGRSAGTRVVRVR